MISAKAYDVVVSVKVFQPMLNDAKAMLAAISPSPSSIVSWFIVLPFLFVLLFLPVFFCLRIFWRVVRFFLYGLLFCRIFVLFLCLLTYIKVFYPT